MEIVPLKKICSTLGRKKHENILGFHVFMFFLHSVEQIFFKEQFPFNFFCTFFASRKNPKTQKPENMKT